VRGTDLRLVRKTENLYTRGPSMRTRPGERSLRTGITLTIVSLFLLLLLFHDEGKPDRSGDQSPCHPLNHSLKSAKRAVASRGWTSFVVEPNSHVRKARLPWLLVDSIVQKVPCPLS